MDESGVRIETLLRPELYTAEQLELACLVAAALDRGKLVLLEPPQNGAGDR